MDKPSRFAAASSLLYSSLVTRQRNVLERRSLGAFGGLPPVRFFMRLLYYNNQTASRKIRQENDARLPKL